MNEKADDDATVMPTILSRLDGISDQKHSFPHGEILPGSSFPKTSILRYILTLRVRQAAYGFSSTRGMIAKGSTMG
jgi:hypothetical protein